MNLSPENIIYEPGLKEAIYYTVIKCPDRMYRLYSNQWYRTYRTVIVMSYNGLNFSTKNKTVFKDSGVTHNFFPFYGKDDKLYGIGGIDNWKYDEKFHGIKDYNSFVKVYESKFRESSKSVNFNIEKHKFLLSNKKILNHVRGLYLFESKDGVNWDQVYEAPIITVFDKGYTNAIRLFGKSSEFDGHVNCLYHEEQDLYYLYLRANVAKGFRYIQYSTSKNLKTWSEFKLVNLQDYNRRKDNYYTPCMFKYESIFIGIIPYFNIDNKCCLKIYKSENGVDWELLKIIFKDDTAFYRGEKPKNTKHFVNGYVEEKGNLHFYIHENFHGLNRKKPVTIRRYTISKQDWDKFIGL